MKKWNQIVSLLMSAALLTGLSCAGAGAESDGPLGAGGAGSYVSWEDSQGAVSEANGQVTLTLTGGTVITFTSAHLDGTVSFAENYENKPVTLKVILLEPGCVAYSTTEEGQVYADEAAADAAGDYAGMGQLFCYYYGAQANGEVMEMMADDTIIGNAYAEFGIDGESWEYEIILTAFFADDGQYCLTTRAALDRFAEVTGAEVTGTSTGAEEQPAGVSGFSDVSADAWYAGYVQTVAEKGLFSGNEDGTFAPEANMTYAQFLVVLSQFSGDAIPGAEGAWYQGYVDWADEAGLIPAGMGESFNPDAPITRQDMAALFGSFLNAYDHSGGAVNEGEASFADAGSIADYAADGVQICYQLGIMSGKDGGAFDPMGTATRAEVAVTMTQMARVMGR